MNDLTRRDALKLASAAGASTLAGPLALAADKAPGEAAKEKKATLKVLGLGEAKIACAALAASRAGARELIVGTASQLGDAYMIDLKLLDARSAVELRRSTKPVSGSPDALIDTPPEIAAAYQLSPADCEISPGVKVWDAWIESFPRRTPELLEAPGAIIYTSGTTGRPKGVRRHPPSRAERRRGG